MAENSEKWLPTGAVYICTRMVWTVVCPKCIFIVFDFPEYIKVTAAGLDRRPQCVAELMWAGLYFDTIY